MLTWSDNFYGDFKQRCVHINGMVRPIVEHEAERILEDDSGVRWHTRYYIFPEIYAEEYTQDWHWIENKRHFTIYTPARMQPTTKGRNLVYLPVYDKALKDKHLLLARRFMSFNKRMGNRGEL